MSNSNYLQLQTNAGAGSAGPQGQNPGGQHLSPHANQFHGHPQQQQQQQQMNNSYSSRGGRGGAAMTTLTTTNNTYYDYPGAAGGDGQPNNGADQYSGIPSTNNNGQGGFSYSSLGGAGGGGAGGTYNGNGNGASSSYGSLGGNSSQTMMMNGGGGGNGDFSYTSLAASPYATMGGGAGHQQSQQHQRLPYNQMSRWGDPAVQQQQQYHQQQQPSQDYHQSGGRPHNGSASSYSNISYLPNNNNTNSHHASNDGNSGDYINSNNRQPTSQQQPHVQIAIPPPPPPPPASYLASMSDSNAVTTNNASARNTQQQDRKRSSRWGNNGSSNNLKLQNNQGGNAAIAAAASARMERLASREDPPKHSYPREDPPRPKPPPPLPSETSGRDAHRDARAPRRMDSAPAPSSARMERLASREDPPRPKPPPPLPAESGKNAHQNGPGGIVSMASSARMERLASREDPPRPPPPRKEVSVRLAPAAAAMAQSFRSDNAVHAQTDNAVNAINALSNLQNQWSIPNQQQQNKKAKKKRRRGPRQKDKTKNNGTANSNDNNKPSTNGAGNMGNGVWIDVDHDAPSKRTKRSENWKETSKIGHQKLELNASGRDEKNFPPLISNSQQGGKVVNNADKDPRLVSLEDVSTSQLTSYAKAIEGALAQTGGEASKSQDGPSLEDEDEEMDISDEEDEEIIDEPEREVYTKDEALKAKVPELTVVDLTSEANSPAYKDVVNLTQMSDPGDAFPNKEKPVNQDPKLTETEKNALKLAELKAKARALSAKVRIAKLKKAQGINNGMVVAAKGSGTAAAVASSKSVRSTSQQGVLRTNSSSPKPAGSISTIAPISKSRLPDITALRTLGTLIVEDVHLAGPLEEVRFVHSVYKRSSSKGGHLNQKQTPVKNNAAKAPSPPPTPASAPSAQLQSEEKRKKSDLLKKKIEMAKLQLKMKQMKDKKAGLEKKKQALLNDKNESNLESKQKLRSPLPANLAVEVNQLREEKKEEEECIIMEQESDPVAKTSKPLNVQDNQPDDSDRVTMPEQPQVEETPQAKLANLRRRQKELKQKNDIANLRNLIHRQRDLLQAQGNELTVSSIQLQSCVDDIRTKQTSLDDSEKRLEEMTRRKKIVEGMVLRATGQLMRARKVLGERRRREDGSS